MIPSKNEGIEERAREKIEQWEAVRAEWKADPEAFAKKHGLADAKTMPRDLNFYPKVAMACDCCGKALSDWFGADFFVEPYVFSKLHYADRGEGFVRVLDKIYFGCKRECSTALFTIHHQYAMRERLAEGRFVHLAYDFGEPSTHQPVLLDLDAATMMAIVEDSRLNRKREEDPDDELVELRWWVSNYQNLFGYVLIRRQAKRIMDLWRARPARSLVPTRTPEQVAVRPHG